MNPYAIFGSGVDTFEASSLSKRLTAWHDAMVAHERRLRTGRTSDLCSEVCPHADARALWVEAQEVFGTRANELPFLRSRGTHASRQEANETAGHAIRHGEDEAADVSDAPPAMRRGAFAARPDRSHVTTAEQ
ncbi:MAG: hypothetical protein ABJC51_07505 [Acidobacteriota bacterium]